MTTEWSETMKFNHKRNIFLAKAGLKLVSIVGITQIAKTVYNIGKIRRLIKKL